MNQGESRICENHEIFTLKNKILSPKEIKQDVHQGKKTFIQLYRHMHTFIIGGLCQLLWTVKGTLYKQASLGTRSTMVDLPIISLLAPPNELRYCYKRETNRRRLHQSLSQSNICTMLTPETKELVLVVLGLKDTLGLSRKLSQVLVGVHTD